MRNIDYINLQTSKKLGLSVDVVKKVNSYYWNAVKNKMRSMDNDAIYIKEIGTFSVSNFKIKAYIKRLRTYIKNLRQSQKYTENRKEIIIRHYKNVYSKLLKAQKNNEEILNYLKTYRKNQNDI